MTSASVAPRPPRWLPWLLGLAALLPLLVCWRHFRVLFWFGDEWDQLNFISVHGFWRWMWDCFGENFAPAFKLSWGGLALASGGNYTFVVIGLWLAHAGCVGLLAHWLLRVGIGALATATTVLILALASTNIETLGWTIQLITVQGVFFFLAAAEWHHAHETTRRWSTSALLVLAALVTVSTFSTVRGSLAGGSLAATTIIVALAKRIRSGAWELPAKVLLVCLVPAMVSVGVIMVFAPGNQHHLAAIDWHGPAVYSASYFFLNPIYKFFTDHAWSTTTLLGFVVLKTTILLTGGWKATPTQRRLLVTVLVFDLGNAALMGLGRYQEPLYTATSSRYQYISLVCLLPFVAILLDTAIKALRAAPMVRRASAIALLAVVAFAVGRRWILEMPGWSTQRGADTRRVIFREPNPPAEGAIPGIPFLRTSRAKEIVQEYHLH